MTGADFFNELFVLEMANNHLGSLERGLKIISAYGVHLPEQAIQISDPIKKVGAHTVKVADAGHTTEIRVQVVKNGN